MSKIGMHQVVLPACLLLCISVHAENTRQPVIDMHLHAYANIWADIRPCYPKPCTKPSPKVSDPALLPAATLEQMEKYNVVLGVISGPRDEVVKWTESHGEKFVIGQALWRPDDMAYADLKKLLETGQVEVLGELAFQYEGIPIDDPSVDPLLALAHELDVPVHVHVQGLGGPNPPIHIGNPARIAKVLRKYPGLRIYLENAGWPYLDEVTALMYGYPSVYADISTILHLFPENVAYKYMEELVDNGLGKRLMFGSDQMIWPEVIGENIELIEAAGFLTEEQKRDILYNNAARFLRLTDEEIAAHHADRHGGDGSPARRFFLH